MKRFSLIAALSLIPALAACGDVADTLGLGRNPPDEFAVVDRPPLALPPDFDLRPPKPGAPRPQDINASKKASATLFGANTNLAGAPGGSFLAGAGTTEGAPASDAEKAILESAGFSKADPNIRELVDREASQKVVGNRHLVDDLLWWRKTEAEATTVDAQAEAERIKEAKEKNAPLNQGATPVIERKKSSWLGL